MATTRLVLKKCASCKEWHAVLVCPDCAERVPCGELLDIWQENVELAGDVEDSIVDESVQCNCGWFAVIEGYVSSKERDDGSLSVVFSLEE